MTRTKLITSRNLAAMAATLLPSVDVDGKIVAAHDTDAEREAFVPARLGVAALKAAFAQPPGKTNLTRVLVVGSSNAAGQGATTVANSWVGRLSSALSATHVFINPSISGISPAYWVTADATTGRSPLEQAIIDNQPHIVVVAFTAQNAGGPSHAFLGWVNQALNTCTRFGARCVAVTPYISTGYSAAARDENKRLASALRRKGIPLLDFASIWGTAATIPAAIDTGDGLHINNTGHQEQYQQIPADYLSLSADLPRSPRFAVTGSGGLTVPAGAAGGAPMLTSGFPASSFTVALEVTTAALGPVVLMSFGGTNTATRVRVGATVAGQLDVAGGVVHPGQTAWATGSTHHLAMTYNAITKESVLYVDGVAVSTVAVTGTPTFTSLAVGENYPGHTFYATGYTFRNVTVHSTVLAAEDVARLAKGIISTANLCLAVPLDDATGRPVGGLFAPVAGQAISAATGIALP